MYCLLMSEKNKQSKNMRLLLGTIIVIGVFSFVWRQQKIKEEKKAQAIIQQLMQVQQARDEEVFDQEKDSIKQQLALRKNWLQEAIEQALDDEETSLEELSSSQGQWEMLKKLHDATEDKSLLPALFQISLNLRKFDDALFYLDALQASNGNAGIDVHKYLYALFNSKSIDFASLGRFKQVIQKYEENELITPQDSIFYYSLITLSRGDLESYAEFMEWLRWTKYDERVSRYDQSLERDESFVDTPEYYLKGLLSIGLFQQEWYRPVQHISRDLIEKDSKYLLWYQLNAYTAMLLSDRNEALQSLDFLKNNDQPNKNLYLYLQWVALYHQERYQEALLAFNQIPKEAVTQDAIRYQYLSYGAVNDKKWVKNTLQLLIATKDLNAYDYYTIFDLLFFNKEGVWYLSWIEEDIAQLMNSCYEQVTQDFVYVCLYGKAGMNIRLWNTKAAYQYLTHASQRFPNKEIFELLGDLAQDLEKTQDATKRYIKAITSTSVVDQQSWLRKKIKDLMK